MKIEGNEFDIRRFISSYYAQDYQELEDMQIVQVSYMDIEHLEEIRNIVTEQIDILPIYTSIGKRNEPTG